MAENKTATLVVGADSDMGCEIIRGLSGVVIAHFYLAPEKLEGLSSPEREIIPIKGDLSSLEGINKLAEDVKALGYDVAKLLHLPSGPAIPCKFRDFDEQRFLRDFNISYMSAALLCRAFVPAMAKRRFGRVVFMLTSYCIGVPPKFIASYVSCKYAVLGLMRSLAAEYAEKGVTVNAVAPSMAQTSFLSSLSDLTVEANAKNHPLGRNARVDDIAPAALLLLDDKSEFLCGDVIPVTGGSQF